MAEKLKPTQRAVIDVGRKCNLNCRFCYHKHLGDLRYEKFLSFEQLKQEVNSAHDRGNKYIDLTGGEPTLFPEICELIDYIHEKEMKVCIITNGLCGFDITETIIQHSCVDEFLVSVHGLESTHNFLTDNETAYSRQRKFFDTLHKYNQRYRINCVINRYNQNELYEIACDIVKNLKPDIVNFINFNPLHNWQNDNSGVTDVQADLFVVEEQLKKAIPLLEMINTGVNVRYYPMCRLPPELRKNICNDLHVTFDPYEWDYCIYPKDIESHVRWAISGTEGNEHKGYPCNVCDLQWVCGGINKYFNEVSDSKYIQSIEDDSVNKHNIYHYRKDNNLSLVVRY